MDRVGEPRIALFGIFGVGNFGNEASLQAMILQLRRRMPLAELCCICMEPGQVAQDYQVRSVGIRTPDWRPRHPLLRSVKRLAGSLAWRLGLLHAARLARALWHLRRFDWVVFPGTGLLDDFLTDPWMWPCDLLIWSAAAKFWGCRMAALSIGAGPIRDPRSRWLMGKAAELWDYRSYRNEHSKEFMMSLGIDSRREQLAPDLVFSLPIPGTEKLEGSVGKVAVGVMNYHGWSQNPGKGEGIYRPYVEVISRFVGWLLEEGFEVRLVKGEWCDQHAVDEVLERTLAACNGGQERVAAAAMETFAELTESLKDVDVVVATRFHNVVAALMMGKPTVSIGYSSKNDQLMKQFGLEAYCQQMDALDFGRLREQFLELLQQSGEYAVEIRACSDRFRDQLEEQYAWLERILWAEKPVAQLWTRCRRSAFECNKEHEAARKEGLQGIVD